MKSLVLFFGVVFAATAPAQNVVHKVVPFEGAEQTGVRLLYQKPIMQEPYFDLDGLRIETEKVGFFRNNHGYFANLCRIAPGKERYAMKIKSGIISQYEEIDILIYGGDALDLHTQPSVATNPLLATGESFQFYTKNNGAITKANFRNLKTDIGDNTESATWLRAYRRYRWMQRGTLVAGAGITAGSFLVKPGDVKFTPLSAFGLIVFAGSYLFEYAKKDALYFAVDAFNRQ
jgi:hypothetical protein